MTNLERLKAEKPLMFDAEVEELCTSAAMLTHEYNATSPSDKARRAELIRRLFVSDSEAEVLVIPPVRTDFGINVRLLGNFYAGGGSVFIDTAPITIGNNVMFGPNVSLITALHPLSAEVRRSLLFYGKPIVIEDDVWLGAGVIVNPGVRIGSGSVIGSGSIVTRDIPSGVIAFGNPCRVHRKITPEDKEFDEKMLNEYLKSEA